MKKYWKLIQQHLGVDEARPPGPKTALALLEKLDIRQPEHSWPSQEEVRSGKSVFGRAGDESNMTSIKLPYVMRLAWETNTTVSTMRCHKLVAEPLVRIFQAALDHYGMEKIGAADSTTAPLSAEKPHPCTPGESPWTWIRTETD